MPRKPPASEFFKNALRDLILQSQDMSSPATHYFLVENPIPSRELASHMSAHRGWETEELGVIKQSSEKEYKKV